MKVETLKQGRAILDKIIEMKNFKKAFNSPYMCSIIAHNWVGNEECPKSISVNREDELYGIINDYLGRKIKELEDKFEAL